MVRIRENIPPCSSKERTPASNDPTGAGYSAPQEGRADCNGRLKVGGLVKQPRNENLNIHLWKDKRHMWGASKTSVVSVHHGNLSVISYENLVVSKLFSPFATWCNRILRIQCIHWFDSLSSFSSVYSIWSSSPVGSVLSWREESLTCTEIAHFLLVLICQF